MPRLACSVLSIATMLSAVGVTGCDSGTEMVVTQTKKDAAAGNAKALDEPLINKRTGKKVGMARSFKGYAGGGAATKD
jgi:hypothetical protein